MPNEEYQRLLRSRAGELRERLPGSGRGQPRRRAADRRARRRRAAARRSATSAATTSRDLLDAFAQADAVTDRPSVIFAYTIKAWRLPTQGHPANHSALLTAEQWEELAGELGADADRPVGAASPRARPRPSCAARAAERLARASPSSSTAPPRAGRRRARARGHGLDAAGVRALLRRPRARGARGRRARRHGQPRRRLLDEPRRLDQPRRRSGTSATGSTGSPTTPTRWCAGARPSTASTSSWGSPRATSSGCSASSARRGRATARPLLPIGTIYDPFVNRALEPWSFGMYAGGQSILVGTPSGVTLAPEGGAHQSIITPSVGLEQPRCIAWEPAFGQDLEWTLLARARRGSAGPTATSSYFRLTTRPIDQALPRVPEDPAAREARRRQALARRLPAARGAAAARGHARRRRRAHARGARRRRRAGRGRASPPTSSASPRPT